MITIPVANSDLLDRLSILRIKHEKGLQVDAELKMMSELATPVFANYSGVHHLYSILAAINLELWTIEDTKRDYERKKQFDKRFITYSRLVYLLNDERAKMKKMIDDITDSEISEVKSHQ